METTPQVASQESHPLQTEIQSNNKPNNSSSESEEQPNKSSSISPGSNSGPFNASSGIGTNATPTQSETNNNNLISSWFPAKVHDFLSLHNIQDFKEPRLNYSSSEHGVQCVRIIKISEI